MLKYSEPSFIWKKKIEAEVAASAACVWWSWGHGWCCWYVSRLRKREVTREKIKKEMRKSQGEGGDEAIKDFVELEGCRWRSNQRLFFTRRWNGAAGNIDGGGLLMVGVGVQDGLVRVVLMVELRWRETIGKGWGGNGIYCLTKNEKARGIDCPDNSEINER
jgi:hypothetical protein